MCATATPTRTDIPSTTTRPSEDTSGCQEEADALGIPRCAPVARPPPHLNPHLTPPQGVFAKLQQSDQAGTVVLNASSGAIRSCTKPLPDRMAAKHDPPLGVEPLKEARRAAPLARGPAAYALRAAPSIRGVTASTPPKRTNAVPQGLSANAVVSKPNGEQVGHVKWLARRLGLGTVRALHPIGASPRLTSPQQELTALQASPTVEATREDAQVSGNLSPQTAHGQLKPLSDSGWAGHKCRERVRQGSRRERGARQRNRTPGMALSALFLWNSVSYQARHVQNQADPLDADMGSEEPASEQPDQTRDASATSDYTTVGCSAHA